MFPGIYLRPGCKQVSLFLSYTPPECLQTNYVRNALGQVSQVSLEGLSCNYSYNNHGDLEHRFSGSL